MTLNNKQLKHELLIKLKVHCSPKTLHHLSVLGVVFFPSEATHPPVALREVFVLPAFFDSIPPPALSG